MAYNLISCSGFESGKALGGIASVASMGCMKARIGLVILFFILAIIKKWGAEEWGIGFSLIGALVLGLVPYFIVITIFGSLKFAFIIGIIGGLVGGYGGGIFFGDEGGY